MFLMSNIPPAMQPPRSISRTLICTAPAIYSRLYVLEKEEESMLAIKEEPILHGKAF